MLFKWHLLWAYMILLFAQGAIRSKDTVFMHLTFTWKHVDASTPKPQKIIKLIKKKEERNSKAFSHAKKLPKWLCFWQFWYGVKPWSLSKSSGSHKSKVRYAFEVFGMGWVIWILSLLSSTSHFSALEGGWCCNPPPPLNQNKKVQGIKCNVTI